MVYYIGSGVVSNTGAVLTASSPTVTSSTKFGNVAVNDLISFDYTTAGKEYQGLWAIVQSKASDSSITLDRNANYSGTVAFRNSHTPGNKFQLDTINSMRFSLQTQAEIWGMPSQTSRSALFFDGAGVIRTITISGVFSDTANNVTTFLDNISELQTGSQFSQTPYLLCTPHLMWNSGNGAWYLVAIKSFDWDYLKPNGTAARYTLQCVERQ